MFIKYNLLPGSCHFLPFSVAGGTNLHFSYTPKNMYCKCEISLDNEPIVYVEVRELDKATRKQLDSMSTDDYIGPMQIFGKLPSNHISQEHFDNLIYLYYLGISSCNELIEERKKLELDSAEYNDVDSMLGIVMNEQYEYLKEIEHITTTYNNESGYALKTKSINPS